MVHPVFAHMPTTVFEEMSGLARATGAVSSALSGRPSRNS